MDHSQMSDEMVEAWQKSGDETIDPYIQEKIEELDTELAERRKREEWCKGLRQLANVIEQHPEVDLPFGTEDWGAIQVYIMGKEQMAALVRAMPCKAEKNYDSNFLNMRFKLGEFCMNAYVSRSTVCERIVVASKEVITMVPDPDAPMVQKVEIVEEIEWRCDEPLLA